MESDSKLLNEESSWRIFSSIGERGISNLRSRQNPRIPSYEEFLLEQRKHHHRSKVNLLRENAPSLQGDLPGNVIELEQDYSNSSFESEDEEISEISDGENEDESPGVSSSTMDEAENSCNSKNESSSESSSDKEEAVGNFIRKLSLDLKQLNEDEKVKSYQHTYTSLTNYVIRTEYKERGFASRKFQEEKPPPLNPDTRFLTLSAEQKLPLLQVLDTIQDINKVLKMGKLTPRMERILEYKQGHPYQDGYQEEVLGFCPWLVFKLEMMLKRFFASQWPN